MVALCCTRISCKLQYMDVYGHGKGKKVISKTNIMSHRDGLTHSHARICVDTGKMRNKIDMFNVKCRKNHTIRIFTSIMFCELMMAMWYELNAQLLIVQSKLYEVKHKEEVWLIFQLKMPIKKWKEKKEAKKKDSLWRQAENNWVESIELWSSNCNGYAFYAVTNAQRLHSNWHAKCANKSFKHSPLYSLMRIPCKCKCSLKCVESWFAIENMRCMCKM